MPDTAEVFIPTRKTFEEILESKVDSVLTSRIPQIIRQANRKPYLSTKDVKEQYGISYRMQKYYRDECGLVYIQEGKKITYDTEELEKFLDGRKFNSEK